MSEKKRSIISSVLAMKCPRCREGNLFKTHTFSFQKPFEMPDHCPICKQNYMPEPGFYFGAMFISYIMWGFISLGICLPLVFVLDWSVNAAFALLLLVSAIFFIWLFRTSRSIWIHIAIKYDPQKSKMPKTT